MYHRHFCHEVVSMLEHRHFKGHFSDTCFSNMYSTLYILNFWACANARENENNMKSYLIMQLVL